MRQVRPKPRINLRGAHIIDAQRPQRPGHHFYFVGLGVTYPGQQQRLEGIEAGFPEPITYAGQLFNMSHEYAKQLKEAADDRAHAAAKAADPEAPRPDTPLPEVSPIAYEFLRFEPAAATQEPPPAPAKELIQ